MPRLMSVDDRVRGSFQYPGATLYIVGPYRAETPEGIARNIATAAGVWDALTEAGYHAICPHTASAALDSIRERDDAFWLDWTMRLMLLCDGVAIMDGWEESAGSVAEVERARAAGLYVGTVGEWLG